MNVEASRPQSDTQAAFSERADRLVARDPQLAALVRRHGVPTVWLRPAGFPSLVLFILEQQVSLASAAAAYGRVLARIKVMTPTALAGAGPDELRAAGVSRQKERYLRSLAQAVASGALDVTALPRLSDDEVRNRLESLPGIGRWTSEVYLLACLDRPDVWPVGDRALQVAVAEALELDSIPTAVELEAIGDRWRPLRATAARLLWHGYLNRRGRVETPVSVLGDLTADTTVADDAPSDPTKRGNA